MQKKITSIWLTISVLFWLSMSVAKAAWETNLPQGVTKISQEVYDLHMLMLWICVAIGVIVFGIMAYSIVVHRKSKGHRPANFHESTTVEILWTIIPFFILIAMAIPATKTLIKMEETGDSDITVVVTGHQWKWEYNYEDSGVHFFSNLHPDSKKAATLNSGINPEDVDNYLLEVDNRLVLPINKKIRFILTSDDVLHAWWIPEFAIKKDAIPGFINDMWTKIEKPGVYRGQCAELCGRDHGFMPIVVEAVSQEEYEKWTDEKLKEAELIANSADREWSFDELMQKGESVYQTSCASCHQPDGSGISGIYPSLLKTEIITGPPANHIEIIMNGVPGTAMQAFSKQLSDVDIAAVTTYERNAWGNDTKDAIQPSTIKNMR